MTVSSRKLADEHLASFQRQAYQYGRKHFKGFDLAEDFSSFAIERVLLGRVPNLKWLYIEFVRETLGRTTNSNTGKLIKAKRKIKHFVPIDFIDDIPAPAEHKPNGFFEMVRDLNPDREERIILILMHYWGLSAREIAQCFGYTEAVVSVKMKAFREAKFRKHLVL